MELLHFQKCHRGERYKSAGGTAFAPRGCGYVFGSMTTPIVFFLEATSPMLNLDLDAAAIVAHVAKGSTEGIGDRARGIRGIGP